MTRKNHFQKYKDFRKQFPEFCYQSFKYTQNQQELEIVFEFSMGEDHHFSPKHRFQIPEEVSIEDIPKTELDLMVFHLGMVELISYWKCACPPRLFIKDFKLNLEQIKWWKKLYFEGLGEFFYLNSIETNVDDFMEIICDEAPEMPKPINTKLLEKVMVPIGGGKDSVVSLEILKEMDKVLIPFVINPRGATLESIKNAGYETYDAFFTKRTIDKHLIELNAQGFLNGHTPFSAMLAFLSLIAARFNKAKYIALSNESSANESTVSGTNINHQYSKSFEFEEDFRNYYQKYIHSGIEYFSFLRPISELQIASLFSKFKQHHLSFRSCNVGSKENIWCGHCPKCLFTYILLSPFIPQQEMHQIFGKALLNDMSLKPDFLELRGLAETKPFECVGTVHEVELSLKNAQKEYFEEALMQNLSKSSSTQELKNALKDWNPQHFVPAVFENLLKEKIAL
ncbi:hypothetical protein [Lentimicrobium sp. S6]|uniref:hypothetical protein n=1 Tax=Lentimicrobium sp. S6 TaxID=2735872 RepID=UPI00155273EE|nr:hypothetical protein [Lentimicrobium sp. S6]NPD47572.1 hypothetical protein [Lentimicrobium sp. S6]